MSVYLDNDEVVEGDSVYDIISKNVMNVVKVGNDSFTVRVRDQEAIVVNGMIGGVRRVYWHNPIILIPRKGDLVKLSKLRQIEGIL